MVSFVSFAFISALIFMISFLLLTLGCFISYFSSCLSVELGYLFDFSPVSWGRLVLLWTFPLALLLLNPIGFGLLCFHFLISFFISSVICWLFQSVLFSLHMFVFLIVFFSCSWHLILSHCDQKRCLRWFQFFLIYQD